MPDRPTILIISPALADANDGNWQTARRWSNFLARDFRVITSRQWDAEPAAGMIALHARRSASSIAQFSATGRPVALVLTGTDLYRDIQVDPAAQGSLNLASRLVVLQERGLDALPPALRSRAEVIYQSARALKQGSPRLRSFDLLLVGHLRNEKDPMTALRALSHLNPMVQASFGSLRLLHIGGEKDPDTAAAFRASAGMDSRVRMLGALPHAQTRQWIRRARLLLLPSRIEGGANVLVEAVTAGVPVLASRIPGSEGMLGPDYDGYFAAGDHAGLAELIARCQLQPEFLERLRRQCEKRAALFEPKRERAAVRRLAHNLVPCSANTPRR